MASIMSERAVPSEISALRRRRSDGCPLQKCMGHAKLDTTLNVYAQVLDGAAREAAATVELFTIVHKPGDSGEQPTR